jgi:Tol biopolymer transport system component
MRKIFLLQGLFLLFGFLVQAQKDSVNIKGIFQKLTEEIKSYKIDTTSPPKDKMSQKIIQLRELKGGFNINEAIAYKMQEEESKNEISKAKTAYLKQEFENGKGKQWLDNAVIHIYRQHFTYKELKQLVKFYKTPAGQKLATDFPYIMMKTLMAAQIIHDALLKNE